MKLQVLNETEERAQVAFNLDGKFFVVDFNDETELASVLDVRSQMLGEFRDPKPDGELNFTIKIDNRLIDWCVKRGFCPNPGGDTKPLGLNVYYSVNKFELTTCEVAGEATPQNTQFVLSLIRVFKNQKPILIPGTFLPKTGAIIQDNQIWYEAPHIGMDVDGKMDYLVNLVETVDGMLRKSDPRLNNYVKPHTGPYILASNAIKVLTLEGTKIFDKTRVTGIVKTTKGEFIKDAKTAVDLGYQKNSDGVYFIGRDEINDKVIPWKPATSNVGLGGYHSSGARFDMTTGDDWAIGLEVEKIDPVIKRGLSYKQLQSTYGWTVETDSSLGSEGFELISPRLPLYNTRVLSNHFESLRPIIDADFTDKCGGHIHMSTTRMSNTELFDMLSGYFPLLFAMYPERAANSYSQAFSKNEMKKSGHRQAISITNYGTVEFRIFPAVASVETIQRRLDLLRFFTTNLGMTYAQVAENLSDKGHLFDLLRGHYGRIDYNNILDRLVYYTELFEREQININYTKLETL